MLLGIKDTCEDGCVLFKNMPSFLYWPLEIGKGADVVLTLNKLHVQWRYRLADKKVHVTCGAQLWHGRMNLQVSSGKSRKTSQRSKHLRGVPAVRQFNVRVAAKDRMGQSHQSRVCLGSVSWLLWLENETRGPTRSGRTLKRQVRVRWSRPGGSIQGVEVPCCRQRKALKLFRVKRQRGQGCRSTRVFRQ